MTLRAGISGTGATALLAVQQLRRHEHCDVVAAHDPDPAARARFTAATGIRTTTGEFAELLGTGVDFVIFTGPCGARRAQVEAAADQGVHCLLHAPMAPDVDTAAAMVAACERAQVKLGVAVAGQDCPVFEQLRRMVAADWLGGPVLVQALWGENLLLGDPARSDDWRREPALAGADPMLAVASHHVHLASWLLGRSVRNVTAQGSRGVAPRPADTTVATVRFRGDVLGTFAGSHLTRGRSLAVHGTDGAFRLADDRLWLCGRREFRGEVFDYLHPNQDLALPLTELAPALAATAPDHELHGRFARWLDDCDDFPCPGEQALEDLHVLAAIARAVASGRSEVP